MPSFYDNPADMEPLVPKDATGTLEALGWEIVRRVERLGGSLNALTAAGLMKVTAVMNSYYGHRIEGHGTTPADLAAVLRKKKKDHRNAANSNNCTSPT